MQNNKNGGKRVRTPLTSSGKKLSAKGKKPEKKEPKLITLLFAGGLAVFLVMFLAVFFITKVKEPQPEIGEKQEITQEKTASKEAVLDAVYLSLFTYGLDKNSIKDKTEVESDTEAEIKMVIDPFHIEETKLKQTISEKLTALGMVVNDDEQILATNGRVKMFIDFSAPEVIEKPKPNSIAFLIDDCGYSLPLAKKLASLPYPVTFAILPHTKFAAETAKIARKAGKTVFLHQPMQPISYPDTDPGKGAILINMPEKQVKSWLKRNVEDIGKIDGFNNHMGSALTQSSEKMRQVFKYIKGYTNTFIDSYTAKGTVAYDECKKAGFRCGLNRKFIDNETDYSYIRSKIIEGTEIARNDGNVIMIGHLRESTVEALAKIMPELEQAGYHLVSAAELALK